MHEINDLWLSLSEKRAKQEIRIESKKREIKIDKREGIAV
jgi:hypothetical protein